MRTFMDVYKYIKTDWLIKDLLGDGEQLYFAPRTALNDPFELVGGINVEYFDKSGRKVVVPDYNKAQNETFEQVKDKIGIFCCSAVCDDITMWAYYADSHKGCCIELDTEADPDFFNAMDAVSYSDKKPSIDHNPRKGPDIRINDVVYHKASCWVHEKEYRVVRLSDQGPVDIKPEAIKTIIFGCMMDKSTRTDIINRLNGKPCFSHVELKQAVPDNTYFKLKFRDIDRK